MSGGASLRGGILAGGADKARTDAQLGLQNRQFATNLYSNQQDQVYRQQQQDLQRDQLKTQQDQFNQRMSFDQAQYANGLLRQWQQDDERRAQQDWENQYRQNQADVDLQYKQATYNLNQQKQDDLNAFRDDTTNFKYYNADLSADTKTRLLQMRDANRLEISHIQDATRRAQIAQRQDDSERRFQAQQSALQQRAAQFGVTTELKQAWQAIQQQHFNEQQQIQRDAQAAANQRAANRDATERERNGLPPLSNPPAYTGTPQGTPAMPLNQINNTQSFMPQQSFSSALDMPNYNLMNPQMSVAQEDWQEQPVPVANEDLPQGNGPAIRVTGRNGETHDFVDNGDGTVTDMQTGRRYLNTNGILRAI